LLATAGSLCGLPFATEEWHAYVYGVGLGIASGAVALLFFAAWSKMYGKRDLGRIQGIAQMFTVFASALGPWIISMSKRATTSYTFIFLLLAGLVFLMAIAAWFTPVPNFTDAGTRLPPEPDDRAPTSGPQMAETIRSGAPGQYKAM
jgi:MFS family permease